MYGWALSLTLLVNDFKWVEETNSKQTLNHELVLKKVHKVIKFNQKAWPKPHIDMNTELRKKNAKNDSEEKFYKLSCSFWKTHGDIKLVTNEARKNYARTKQS